jgi:hypothetical protein
VVNAVSGVTSGKSATITFTVTDGTTVFATVPAVTFTTGGVVINSIAVAFDADSYAAGDKATLVLTAKDAAGNPVADGTYAVFKAIGTAYLGLTTSASVTSIPFASTAAAHSAGAGTEDDGNGVFFTSGVAKSKFYVPVVGGPFNVSGTLTTASTSYGLTAAASVAGTATVSAATTVTSAADTAAQAAIDAAQEATDAANAAYDAANNAMDSADAATAAAQDASDNASAALAAVTSLSATVAKLVASVSAITTALASIKKKLGVK